MVAIPFGNLVILILTTTALGQQPCPYEKFVAPNEVHTACLPANTSCTSVRTGVSPAEKEQIVKLHNELRNKVASGQEAGANGKALPRASNMRELTWDDELEKIAQAHADQCTLASDCYRCRFTEDYATGENIFYQYMNMMPKNSNWNAAVDYWKQSSKELSSIQGNKYKFSAFTQLVWAQTKKIGCGLNVFQGTEYRFTEYYVCIYGPAGNNVIKNVYEQGTPCSGCFYKNVCCGSTCEDMGITPDYPYLCEYTK